MERRGHKSGIETHALECVVAAIAALLAADGIRTVLAPFRGIIGLLLGP
jgi:hypothetical protein